MTELFTGMHWASRDAFACKYLLSYVLLSTAKEFLSTGYFLPYYTLIRSPQRNKKDKSQ